MDIQTIQKPLTQFRHNISQNIHVDELIVFGSYARGEATTESDIDVIVVSTQFEGIDEDKRLDLLFHASEAITPEIQPWGFTPAELLAYGKLTTVASARDNGVHLR